MMELSMDMMKMYPGGDKLTEEQVKKLIDLSVESAKGMRSMSMMMGVGKPGESIYGDLFISITVDDAKAYLADYEKTMEQMVKLAKDADVPWLGAYKLKKIDIDGTPALRMTADIGEFFGEDAPPEMEEMLEKMFGAGGKLDVYMAAADEKTVVGVYVSKKHLAKAIQAVKDPETSLAKDKGILKMTALLPKGSQWIGFINPQGALQFTSNMMATIVPEEARAGMPEFPKLPKTPPVAFGAKLTATGLETDMVIPAAVLKAVGKLIRESMERRPPPPVLPPARVPEPL